MSARGLNSLIRRAAYAQFALLHDGQLGAAQAVHRSLPSTVFPQSPAYKSFWAWIQPILSPRSQFPSFLSQPPTSVHTHLDPYHLLRLDILLKTFSHPLTPCSGTCGKD